MIDRVNHLPPRLRAIYDEVSRQPIEPGSAESLRGRWDNYLDQLRQRVPSCRIEAGGEIVVLGDLSPGCQACKDGTWDCFFITMRCNCQCPFCYSPRSDVGFTGSGMGHTADTIRDRYRQARIEGVSFSGGEALLEPEALFRWLEWARAELPGVYTWVYTNGLLAGEPITARLTELGLDEIRFNMAATDYNHPAVIENIRRAAKHVPHITVEIPAIPAHEDQLLSVLADWADAGVRFLNLHEQLCEPGTPSESMPGDRLSITMPDGHRSAINPHSRRLTLKVMEAIQTDGLPISVNDCSLQSKIRQLRGRRRMIAPLVKAPCETLVDDLFLESCCSFDAHEVVFLHPDNVSTHLSESPSSPVVRLRRTTPLSIDDPGRWVHFEWLNEP